MVTGWTLLSDRVTDTSLSVASPTTWAFVTMWCSSTATPEPSPTGWPPLETSADTTDGLTF